MLVILDQPLVLIHVFLRLLELWIVVLATYTVTVELLLLGEGLLRDARALIHLGQAQIWLSDWVSLGEKRGLVLLVASCLTVVCLSLHQKLLD